MYAREDPLTFLEQAMSSCFLTWNSERDDNDQLKNIQSKAAQYQNKNKNFPKGVYIKKSRHACSALSAIKLNRHASSSWFSKFRRPYQECVVERASKDCDPWKEGWCFCVTEMYVDISHGNEALFQ